MAIHFHEEDLPSTDLFDADAPIAEGAGIA